MKHRPPDDAIKEALIQPLEAATQAATANLAQRKLQNHKPPEPDEEVKKILVDALTAPGLRIEQGLTQQQPESRAEPEKKAPTPQATRDTDGLHRRRGIWYYTLNISGQRRFFSTKTKNYQQARKLRAEAEEAQKAGRLPNDLSKWLFEDLLAHVREQRKLHLAENTIRLEKERSVQLLKHFSGIRVSRIDATAIARYQQSRSEIVGTRTINLEIKVLRHVLEPAKTWTAIAPDYKNLPENRQGPGRSLEPEEEKRLFDAARSRPGWEVAYLCALTAANTTARSVEIKTLRISDVNLIDGEVSIRRSKTAAGHRIIPLNAAAAWALARLLERANALGSVESQHYLLPALNKQPGHGTGYDPNRHQKGWRTAWRKLTKAAALPGLRFHDLRHHSISKLAEGGASDQTIMALAGHMDRSMLEHYSHIRSAAKRAAIDSISSYVPTDETPAITKTIQ
jgi:integrase